MNDKNICYFTGNLTDIPRIHNSNSREIAFFTIGNNRSWKNKNTEEWESKPTFINFQSIVNLDYIRGLTKGQPVDIEAVFESYTKTSNNVKTYHSIFIVRKIRKLEKQNQVSPPSSNNQNPTSSGQEDPNVIIIRKLYKYKIGDIIDPEIWSLVDLAGTDGKTKTAKINSLLPEGRQIIKTNRGWEVA